MSTTVDLLSYALATDTEALAWAKIPTSSTSPTDAEKDAMRLILNAITARVENIRGGQVRGIDDDDANREVTERLSGTGKPFLHLRQFPVLSLTSLKSISPVDEAVIETYDVAAGDYRITDTGRLWVVNQSWFPCGMENIEVVYVPGWLTTPDDLKTAALQWAVDWFKTWQKEREPISATSIGGQTTTFYNEAIPKKVLPVIESYRLPATLAAA